MATKKSAAPKTAVKTAAKTKAKPAVNKSSKPKASAPPKTAPKKPSAGKPKAANSSKNKPVIQAKPAAKAKAPVKKATPPAKMVGKVVGKAAEKTTAKASKKPAPTKPVKPGSKAKPESKTKDQPQKQQEKAATPVKPGKPVSTIKPDNSKTSKSMSSKAASTTPVPAKPAPAAKTGSASVKSKGQVKAVTTTISGDGKGFIPYEIRKGEEYMNEQQKEHFKRILLDWRNELMQEVDRTVHHMQDEAANPPDPADRATLEEEFSIELRTRDRERRLIKKIDSTIELIANDDYGYCDSCGVEIGIRRLEARPTANKCIDCKTLDEIKEKQLGSA